MGGRHGRPDDRHEQSHRHRGILQDVTGLLRELPIACTEPGLTAAETRRVRAVMNDRHRCGWATTSAFIDTFTRTMGLTPGSYRSAATSP